MTEHDHTGENAAFQDLVAFLQSPEIREFIDRAAQASALPVAVYAVRGDEEGSRIMGAGACSVCSRVAALPGGNQACRASRAPNTTAAVRRGRPAPFICHMGFACMAGPAFPGLSNAFSLTVGPYWPAEVPDAFDEVREAMAGLGPIERAREPLDLSDVRVLPTKAAKPLLEWIADGLLRRFRDWVSVAADHNGPFELPVPKQRIRRGSVTDEAPYQAGPIAAALAAGNQAQARALLSAVLAETVSGERVRIAVRRARTAAAVGAAIEAAERAGLNAGACWERFGKMIEEARGARTNRELVSVGMRVLGVVRRKAGAQVEGPGAWAELNAIVGARLMDGVTLNEVAEQLGQHPTAVTHRLQRKFGMSFSQYVGRLRIDKAKELLRRTRLSATEVGRRVGIADTSNFSKVFRKFEGMSPLAYRKRFKR